MDEAIFRELASRREDHSLDFKSDLYSSNEELSKDLMAMANLLPPGSTAYILLGVKERADGTREIAGLDLKADRDSNYQQKIVGKLNRCPRFTFIPLSLSEGDVGAFQIIGAGERPYFPIVTAGKLKRFIPQKRIGSSTGDASPDEVREWVMGDRPTTDPALLLQRIPEEERGRVLLITDFLTESFKIKRVPPSPAMLVEIDLPGSAVSFDLLNQKRRVSVPFNGISANVWKDGSHWRVVIEGYLQLMQGGPECEYQPWERAQQ